MFTEKESRKIARKKPHHSDKAAYSRWRRQAEKHGMPTSHPIVTPEDIRARNREYKNRMKQCAR